jgi:hypothetical protein
MDSLAFLTGGGNLGPADEMAAPGDAGGPVEADSEPSGEMRGYLLPIPEPWPILPGLVVREVDNRSGLLASRWCPADSAYTEYFLPGTEPTELCDQTGFRIRRGPCPQ